MIRKTMIRKKNPIAQNKIAIRKEKDLVISELNVKRSELEWVVSGIKIRKDELANVGRELDASKSEIERINKDAKIQNEIININQELAIRLPQEIDRLKKKLQILKNEIEFQIKENKIREELELKELRSDKKRIEEDIQLLDKTLNEKGGNIKFLNEQADRLNREITEQNRQMVEHNLKRTSDLKNIEVKNQALEGREHESGEREKKLNFYNSRLQRFAKQLNVQLKEI